MGEHARRLPLQDEIRQERRIDDPGRIGIIILSALVTITALALIAIFIYLKETPVSQRW